MNENYADIVFVNGDFRTQDETRPRVEAVAVSGNKFLAAGCNRDIERLAGRNARVFDMAGRLGLPGFWDSHCHVYEWAIANSRLELSAATGFAECMALVERAARKAQPGAWIVGQGWNETGWPEPRMPQKEDLDRAAPRNPVILWRCDFHLSAANSMALEIAGIDESTPNPPGGVVERRENGEPSGVLREFASNPIRDVLPPPSEEEKYRALKKAVARMHSMGITAVNDVRLPGGTESAEVFRAWQRLHGNGELDLRTAVQKAEKAGLAVMVHAIGDRANREIVAVLEERIRSRKPGDFLPLLEHRIEHLQTIRPEDLAKLALLNVAACMQPPNLPVDINMIEKCAGRNGKFAYAFRSAIDAGVPVIFSSDCPVCDPAPLGGIHAAATRRRPDGTPEEGWYPDQRVSVQDAVRAYTATPARVHRADRKLGSITPGKLADMVVLNGNIYTEDPMRIHGSRVDLTLFDGRIVFEADSERSARSETHRKTG